MATGLINSTRCANLIFLLVALQQSNWTYSPGQGQRTRSVICLANTITRSSEERFGCVLPYVKIARAPGTRAGNVLPAIHPRGRSPSSAHGRKANPRGVRSATLPQANSPRSNARGRWVATARLWLPRCCSLRPRCAAGDLDWVEERLQHWQIRAGRSHYSARLPSPALLIKPTQNFGVVFNCLEHFCRACCVNQKKE